MKFKFLFNATCSYAQEMKNRNVRDFQDKFLNTAKAILTQHYMYNYLEGAGSEKKVYFYLKKLYMFM